MEICELRSKACTFLDEVFSRLAQNEVEVFNWSIDHLCYRVETIEKYHDYKRLFYDLGELLVESTINGRPISTFKLYTPLLYKDYLIDLIELPAPKVNTSFHEGFEHFEVVARQPLEQIVSDNPQCTFDFSGLDNDFNKELKLKLGEYQVKFHYQSLESVIRLETNEPVFSALKSSRILEQLKPFSPVVAGTFPLGIYNEQSDLDILVSHSELDKVKRHVLSLYGNCPRFVDELSEVKGVRSYIANFCEDDIPIEIFAQTTASINQTAYRHFQIEEQLLKVGSEVFLSEVKKRRQMGLKTEPAFADVLGFQGCPFEKLLELDDLSDLRVYNLLKDIDSSYVC